MDNSIFEQMMSRYPMDTANDRRNATYEVMQQVVLAGLYRGGIMFPLIETANIMN